MEKSGSYYVEPFSGKNYSRLVAIWESAVLETHHFLQKADFDSINEAIDKEYLPAVDLWVAKSTKDGSVCGFMGITDNKLEMLFIHAAERGKGVGKLLLQYAVEKLGVKSVDVNEQNGQAVGFYQKFGFFVINRQECDAQGKPYPILEMSL